MLSSLLALVTVLSVSANEPSQISANHSFSNTSDGLKMRAYSATYETNRRDIFWNYEDAKEEATDYLFGFIKTDGEYLGEISGTKLFSGIGKKWDSNNYSKIELGLHKLEYKDTNSMTPYIGLTQRLRKENNTFELNLNYDFLYTDGGVPGPYEEKLKKLQSTFRGVYTPKDYLRIPYELQYTKISKDNSLNRQSFSVLAGKSYPVWLWLGYRMERLSYDRVDIGYWSPEKFMAHGPQIEWSQTFFSNLTLKASYLYSFVTENNGEVGNSYYASSAIEYGNRNTLLLGMSLYRNKSQQNLSEWWSEGGELYLKYSF